MSRLFYLFLKLLNGLSKIPLHKGERDTKNVNNKKKKKAKEREAILKKLKNNKYNKMRYNKKNYQKRRIHVRNKRKIRSKKR